jgi:LAO/AO transport system kinase
LVQNWSFTSTNNFVEDNTQNSNLFEWKICSQNSTRNGGRLASTLKPVIILHNGPMLFGNWLNYIQFCRMWQQFLYQIQQGDVKALARSISLVENEVPGYELLLQSLPSNKQPVIGITGPPGAGKSTLTDALIAAFTAEGKKVGVLCIDPSSPFNLGALLGDRIRMSDWYNNPNVFIRSLATRGALGGLHPKIIEITDLLKSAPVDCVIIETVGIGQSEIEIAGLADITVVVLVPEAGDEIQTMKAG